MRTLIDYLTELAERLRRAHPSQWILRGVMAGSAGMTIATLWMLFPAWPFAVLVGAATIAALLLPRGHVTTVWCLIMVVWAAAAGPVAPWWYAPVALGCFGIHWAAGACGLGPSFANVDRAVWRPLLKPVWYGVAAIAAGVGIAAVVGLISIPGSLVLVAATLLVLVAGTAFVLWPPEWTR